MTFGSVAVWRRWCSGRRRARPPARLGDLTSFGAAPRSPPVPSGPSGALHTSGAGCADDWLGVSSRSPARPCRRVACFVGPGRCVCLWAAARPLAVRAASFARRVVSKPGQAPPPPTGTAARPSCALRSLHTSGAGSLFGALLLAPPTGTAARPSWPSGALRTCGA